MQTIKNKYMDLRSGIFDTVSQNNDQDLMKLVQMRNVDEDIKEIIILLHSNYKTELKELEHRNNRILSSLIDQGIATIDNVEDLYRTVHKPKKPKTRLEKIKDMGIIEKITASVILVSLLFFLLYTINPDGFKATFIAVKELANSFTSTQIVVQDK